MSEPKVRLCRICKTPKVRREVQTGENAGKVQWRCKKCHNVASIKHRAEKLESQKKRFATLLVHRMEQLKDRDDLTDCPSCEKRTRDASGHCLGECGVYVPTAEDIAAATAEYLRERPRPVAVGPVPADVTIHATGESSVRRKAKGTEINTA